MLFDNDDVIKQIDDMACLFDNDDVIKQIDDMDCLIVCHIIKFLSPPRTILLNIKIIEDKISN